MRITSTITGLFEMISANDTVSIIIPVYNYARFISDALESALKQEVPCEIIVVDDGSTDDIINVLTPYRDCIKLIRQTNRGLSSARNIGIEKASGRYLLFLDADDILGQGVIKEQIIALKSRSGEAVALCRNFLFSTKGNNGKPLPNGEWRRFSKNLDIHLCHFNIGPPAAFLVPRDAVMSTQGFNTALSACEDYDFWLQLLQAGYPPFAGAKARVWYRRHPASMSSNLCHQRRHDVELHLRVANYLNIRAHGFSDAIGSKLLACSAGMLLTMSRLTEEDRSPLILPLMNLLRSSFEHPVYDSFVYEFYLARLYIFSNFIRNLPEFNSHFKMICACVKRADRSAWFKESLEDLVNMVDEWGAAFYD